MLFGRTSKRDLQMSPQLKSRWLRIWAKVTNLLEGIDIGEEPIVPRTLLEESACD